MMAAKTSSADSVELLLKNNADPNLLSEKNDKQNALAFALKTGNQKIISLLSEVTTEGIRVPGAYFFLISILICLKFLLILIK